MESSAFFGNFASPYFGFQLICGVSQCSKDDNSTLSVADVTLDVRETQYPTIASSTGLWPHQGWVHGDWNLDYSADSPSGVCNLSATLNSLSIPGSSYSPIDTIWHQCWAAPVSTTIDVDKYGSGVLPLTLTATDAAGLTSTDHGSVYVDSTNPSLTFSGPTDAPSTAGTQYVTANAADNESGIAGMGCNVDGAPDTWYAGASARIPVSGIGEHTVNCVAENDSVDASGQHGSTVASWNIRIGVPTISAIGFAKFVNALRCHRVRERVMVPAHWVKVRRDHHTERVRRPARTETKMATRCQARSTRKLITVWVKVRRGGKTVRVKRHKTVRVLLLPRVVEKAQKSVRHGHGTTVNGWLGTTDGTALGGQTVQILTAPDNGQGQYTQAATATTAANGTWTAPLPPGPSRLITASYAGSPTTEPASSLPVHLTVPAEVKLLKVYPRRIPWGGTVHLVGKLDGGYLPLGGALVRLRIGEGSSFITYGVHPHVGGSGRFSTTYTFGAGQPSVHRSFWFEIASLPMGDYPYAPANSRRVSVLIGGHPNTRHR